MLAATGAKYNLALILEGPDLLRVVLPLKTPDSYSKQRLNQLRYQGKPVFINFTADWCITCKWNEKLVFTPETLELMQDKGILLIQGDWTHYEPGITRFLEKHGRGGVPLHMLFPPGVDSQPIILPQILMPDRFKNAIESM